MNENIDNYNKKNKIELFEIVTIILTNKIKILISSLVIFAIAVFLHQFFLKNNYDANLNKTKSLFNFTIEINKNELNQIIDYLNSFFVVRQVVFNDINSIKKFETTTTNLIPQTDQNNTPLIKYHQEMLLESLRFFFNNIDVQFEIIKNQLQNF